MKKVLLMIIFSIFSYAIDVIQELQMALNENLSGNYERSNEILSGISDSANIKVNPDIYVRMYYTYGNNYYGLAEYENAINYFEKALKIQKDLANNTQFIATLNALIGFSYQKIAKYDEAKEYLLKSESMLISTKEKNEAYLLKIYVLLADIYSYHKEYATAKGYYQKAYEILNRLNIKDKELSQKLQDRINGIK